MSINNLEQHLSWLLQSKLFIPPPATHALPEVDSPQSAQQLNPAPNDDLFFVQSNDGSQTEDGNELAARAAEPPGGVVMPRVRTAPSPARKPRLVNQSSCPVSGTNLESRKDTATRLRHTDHPPKPIPQTIDFHADPELSPRKTPARPKVANEVGNVARAMVDTVDLTEPELATTHTPSRTKSFAQVSHSICKNTNSSDRNGRKRKSEEFESDLGPPKTNLPKENLREAPLQPPVALAFEAIDSIVDDPPPPYSTAVPENPVEHNEGYSAYFSDSSESCNSKSSGANKSRSAHQSQALWKVSSQQQARGRMLNGRRKCNAAAAGSSPSPTGEPLWSSRRDRKLAVADSDDDYGCEDLDFQHSGKEVKDKNPLACSQGLPKDLKTSQRQAYPLKGDPWTQKPSGDPTNDLGDPHCQVNSIITHSHPSTRELSEHENQARSVEFLPPKGHVTLSASPQLTQLGNGILTSFCQVDASVIQSHFQSVESEHDEACEAYMEMLDDEQDSHEQASLTDKLKRKCEASRALGDAHVECRNLLAMRREIQERVKNAIKEKGTNAVNTHDKNELNRFKISLGKWESQVQLLINQSGFCFPSASPTDAEGTSKPSGIMIASTQVSDHQKQQNRDPLLHKHSSAQSDCVRQTQTMQYVTGQPRNAHTALPKKLFSDFDPTIQRSAGTPTKSFKPNPSNANTLTSVPALGSKLTTNQGVETLRVPHDEVAGGQLLSDEEFEGCGESDNDAYISDRVMAAKKEFAFEQENFGFEDDDDADMLQAAQDLDERSVPSTYAMDKPRRILAEDAGNARSKKSLSSPSNLNGRSQKSSDGPSAALFRFPWSHDIKTIMVRQFQITGFRPNQLEAINATLNGRDVFVLMPTGGGKSLCYQLPSIIQSGKTKGVTIVVSPLLSLMEDQITHLHKLNVEACLLNGETSADERKRIFQALRGSSSEGELNMVYITPEMIGKSGTFVNALRSLYSRQRFARIVIDEAHCVSQWGHDFRPDYKDLGKLREEFPGVPVMALTATATENVKVDIMHNLNISGCDVFTQTFNRPNLTYEVREKRKNASAMSSIAETIKSKYMNQSGIIYCTSRKSCEQVAQNLRKESIQAYHYHAGLEPQEKRKVQQQWQKGKYHVIVATIAFGMGIDKPDVRFVIHYCIPKSLEGYYQETGRAGRDGKRSGCYLYYGFQDVGSIRSMILKDEASPEQKDRQLHMLRRVQQFCENQSDCRRVQILSYFSEKFSKENCRAGCDNCNSKSTFELQDFTDRAASIISLVEQLQSKNLTLLHFMDVYWGKSCKKLCKAEYDQAEGPGLGSDLDRGVVERLFQWLLTEGALVEENKIAPGGFTHQYIKIGRRSKDFAQQKRRLKMHVRISPSGKPMAKDDSGEHGRQQGLKKRRLERKAPTRARDLPQSTNVPSPSAERAPKRRLKKFEHVDDGEDISGFDFTERRTRRMNGYARDEFCIPDENFGEESGEDAFEAVPESSPPRNRSRRPPQLHAPIREDEQMDNLPAIHQGVVENFVDLGKKTCDRIVLNRSLRTAPFSDTMLREMAIRFPKNQEEMLDIPGIDPDKVDMYGDRFLKMIRKAEESYYEMMGNDADRPMDPNHEIVNRVVDLVSDEDEAMDASDDDAASFGEEKSEYFGHSRPTQRNDMKALMAVDPQAAQPNGPARKMRGGTPSVAQGASKRGSTKAFRNSGNGVSKKSHGRKSSGARSGKYFAGSNRNKTARRGSQAAVQSRVVGQAGIGAMPM